MLSYCYIPKKLNKKRDVLLHPSLYPMLESLSDVRAHLPCHQQA